LYKDGKVIGIKLVQILSFESSRILYLAGTAIDPEWQGRGLNSQLTSSLIQSHNIDVMVARTQNPNNYKMLQRFCGTVWPQGDSKPPQFIQKIGLHMADRLGRTSGTFNPQTLVDKDTYGSAIYETIPHPQSSSPEINACVHTMDVIVCDVDFHMGFSNDSNIGGAVTLYIKAFDSDYTRS